MKKVKILSFVLFFVLRAAVPLVADNFDWSQSWRNYGAGIKKDDKLLTVDAALVGDGFGAVADYQIAAPLGDLPFTFGGYAGATLLTGGFGVAGGGAASYHFMLPPKPLDLYLSLKLGVKIYFYDAKPDYIPDWGFNAGAFWFFTDVFGSNVEFGYPYNKIGAVFKL